MDDALLEQIKLDLHQAGGGPLVLCEGPENGRDRLVYSAWSRAQRQVVAFRGVQGCTQVVKCVSEIRAEEPYLRVHGIVDRDYGRVGTPGVEQPGGEFIHTLRGHCIENYLLDPEGWAAVAARLHRLKGPPEGWRKPDEVRQRILDFYQAAVPVTALNIAIHELSTLHRDSQSFRPARFRQSITAARTREDAVDQGRNWAVRSGQADRASELIGGTVDTLLSLADPDELALSVSGKLVLEQLVAELSPEQPRRGRYRTDDELIGLYLSDCPQPPAEIATLLRRISLGESVAGA